MTQGGDAVFVKELRSPGGFSLLGYTHGWGRMFLFLWGVAVYPGFI